MDRFLKVSYLDILIESKAVALVSIAGAVAVIYVVMTKKPTVAVLRLTGPITDQPGRLRYESLNKQISQIDKSFAFKSLKAVCLKINSPGGSPVQSELIAKRIQKLSSEKGVPVYAFVEDVAASGGYFLACGAKEIYASESSVVGSIGVLSQSFGLQEFIKRWGIENLLQAAGENKAIDNPFIEKNEVSIARTERVLANIHRNFISFVKESRGDRLKGEEDHLFSGEYWTGNEALELGLIDGVETDMVGFLKREFGDEVRIVPMKAKKNFLQMLLDPEAMMEANVVDIAAEILDQLEERLDGTRLSTKFR